MSEYEPDHEKRMFDIRTDGFYIKLGGIRRFLELVSKLNVSVVGTKIKKEDLRVIVFEHNETHSERQRIEIDENKKVRYLDETAIIEEDQPEVSELERSILVAIEQPSGHEEPFKIIKEEVKPADSRSILDQYFDTIRSSRNDPKDISLANNLLRIMIEQKYDHFNTRSLTAFLGESINFIARYKMHSTFETIRLIYEYASIISAGKYNNQSYAKLDDLFKEIGTMVVMNPAISEENEILLQKELAKVNKQAFNAFKRVGDRNARTAKTRISARYYLMNLEKLLSLTPGITERKAILDEGLEFLEEYLGPSIPKEALGYTNGHYYQALFCIEKYELTKQNRYYAEAVRAIEYAKKDCESLRNQDIVKDLGSKIVRLISRINHGKGT